MIVLNAVIILLEMKQVQQHFCVCVCVCAHCNAQCKQAGFWFCEYHQTERGHLYYSKTKKRVHTHIRISVGNDRKSAHSRKKAASRITFTD